MAKDEEKALFRKIKEQTAALKPKEKVFAKPTGSHDKGAGDRLNRGWQKANAREDAMIDAIDQRKQLNIIVPIFEKLMAGKIDVQGAIQSISPHIFKEFVELAFLAGSEKVKSEVQKHLLALAGHNPAQKHEISRVDPTTSKEGLLSLLAGTAGELKHAGIEVVDDRADQTKPEES